MVDLVVTSSVVIAVLGTMDLGDTAHLAAVDSVDIMAHGVEDFLDKVDLILGILVDIVDITVLVGTDLVNVVVLGAMDLVDTMALIMLDLTLDILVDIAVLVGTDLMDITAVTFVTGVFTTGAMKSLKRRKTFFLPLPFSLD